METFFLTGNLLTACMVVGVLIGYCLQGKQTNIVRQELQSMKMKYRQMQGFHDWFGVYDLESFDCGRRWYAMVTEEDGRRLILGDAEKIYPGLLAEHGLLDFHKVEAIQEQLFRSINELSSPVSGSQSIEFKSSLDVECEKIEIREKLRRQSHCRSMPVLAPRSDQIS